MGFLRPFPGTIGLRAIQSGEAALNECKFQLDQIDFQWSFVLGWLFGLGLLSALLEATLHVVENKLEDHPTYLPFFRRFLKELVILGFMSLLLILVRDFSPSLTKNQFQMIEFAHLWIFCVGIAFVVNATQIMLMLVSAKRRWDSAFSSFDSLQDEFAKLCSPNSGKWAPPWQFIKRRRLRQKLQLHILRDHFRHAHNLPQSFDFAKYLRTSLTKHTLYEVQLSWRSWLVLCAVFLLGFGVAEGIDAESGGIDAGILARVTFSASCLLFLVALAFLFAVNSGMDAFLRICGCPNPSNISEVMEMTEDIYSREHLLNNVTDAAGRTEDELNLLVILKECRARENLHSLDFAEKHALFDVAKIKKRSEEGVLPCAKPSFFVFWIRVLILAQMYLVGLTILLLLGVHNIQGLSIAFVVLEFVVHIILVTNLFPRIFRDFALLSSLSRMDKIAIDLVEETFEHQQETNQTIFLLASLFYRAFNEGRMDLEGFASSSMPQIEGSWSDFEKTHVEDEELRIFFHGIDKKQKGVLSVRDLANCLENPPFEHHIKKRKLQKVFRALNCVDGMTANECGFLIRGMRSLSIEDAAIRKTMRICFGNMRVKCTNCDEEVDALQLQLHAEICGKSSADAGKIAFYKHRTLENRRQLGRIGSLTGGPKYGLLRPFALPHPETSEHPQKITALLDLT